MQLAAVLPGGVARGPTLDLDVGVLGDRLLIARGLRVLLRVAFGGVPVLVTVLFDVTLPVHRSSSVGHPIDQRAYPRQGAVVAACTSRQVKIGASSRGRRLLRLAPRRQRRGLIEIAHWAFGAAGGAVFGALPRGVRRRPWAGPVYGLAVWLGFEMGIAPVLGLSQAKRVRLVDRLALAADHLLYGLVLSEGRRRPQD